MSNNNLGINLNIKAKMARDSIHDLSSSFVRLSKDGKKADTSILSLTGSMGLLKKAITGVAFYKLARMIGQASQAAMDIRESVHLFNVAMGDAAESTGALISELSELSGLDKIGLLDTTGEYNLLARSMGVTSKNAAVLSENAVKLALDLSSLTNRDIVKVQEDIRSGLIGQSKTMYKYGVDVTEAALKQEAANQGIKKSIRHMSQAEKMQLRYQVMIKQTGLAHGDFAETINTPANQMRILSSRVVSATRSLGTMFIPMLTIVLPYLNAFVKALDMVFKAMARVFGYDPSVNEKIQNTGDAFGSATGDLEDMKDEADKTGKEVVKLKKKIQQLAGFDELNILGSHETPIQPKKDKKDKDGEFGTIDFDLQGFDSEWQGIVQQSDKLFEKMIDWMKKVQAIAKPTTDALSTLWNEGLKQFKDFTIQNLKDFYTEFLIPVGKWALGEEGLPRLIYVLNDLLTGIDWSRLNSHFVDLFQALVPFATTIGTGFIDFIEFALVPLAQWTFNDAVPTMLTSISEALGRIDWDDINEKMRVFFDMLGITSIAVGDILVSFFTDVLVPISEWTLGTGFPRLVEILTKGMELIEWKSISGGFSNLWESLTPFAINVGEGLLWLFDNVLVPLGAWTVNKVLPEFLEMLANVLDILNIAIEVAKPSFDVLWEKILKPIAEFTGGVIISILKGMNGELKAFGKWMKDHPFLADFLVSVGMGIGAVALALGVFAGAAAVASWGAGILAGVIGFLSSPFVLVGLAIGAAIGIGVLMMKNWDKIKEAAGKLWSGVKEKWSNFKEGTRDLGEKVGTHMGNMNKSAQEKVENMKKKVGTFFGEMSTNAKEKAGDIFTNVTTSLDTMNTNGQEKVKDMKKKVGTYFGDLSTNAQTKVRSLSEDAIIKFESMRKNTIEKAEEIKSKVVGKFQEMLKNSSPEFQGMVRVGLDKFGEMKTNTLTFVGDMVKSIIDMPGKMADGITKGAGKVKDAFVDMWRKVVGGIKTPVNAVLGGANWILEKFKADPIPLWEAKGYAKGTKSHPGGHAVVNDQKGATYREAVQFPNGKTIIPKGRNVMIPNMPKGTKVLPAKLTRDLPHYKGGVGNWWDKTKEKASGIWDWVTKPFDLVKNTLKDFVGFGDLGGAGLNMGKGMLNHVTNPMVEWTKALFGKNEKQNPSAAVSGSGLTGVTGGTSDVVGGVGFPRPPYRKTSSYGRRIHPVFGVGRMHNGVDLAAPSGTPINAQHGGKVTNAKFTGGFGNMVKISQGATEQIYAHMSKILTSVGANVEAGRRIGLVGSTGDSTGPHLHYEKRLNGRSIHPGYEKGGFIGQLTPFNVAGESGNEGIVPLEGRHMQPFADAVADRLKEHTQQIIKQSNIGSNSGGVVVKIGERTLVDVLGSEINRQSRINGQTVIRI